MTILVDNTAVRGGVGVEHGLSFWIEYGGKGVLFDTGQSDLVIGNARRLGIDLSGAEAVVLSHGHYDHTGGLAAVLGGAAGAKVYLHPAAVGDKFSLKTGSARYIGMSEEARQAVRARKVVWTEGPCQVLGGLFVTGQVPRVTEYEDTGGLFYRDEGCREADELPDDQTLFIDSAQGLIVVLGCAHSGVVNILDYILRLTGKKTIHTILGGMHLLNAGPVRVANTIERLKACHVQRIVPLHCTGTKAVEEMQRAFGQRCLCVGAGGRIVLD